MDCRRLFAAHHHILLITCCVIGCGIMNQTTQAGNVYIYKDNEGLSLLTNRKVNSGSYKEVKVTYYPDTNVHRYQNWGSSESSVLPSFSKSKDAYNAIIHQAAQNYNVAEGLIKAVMHTESGFNAHARSPVGAQGLMQLMPATARRFNVSDAYDPEQNIYGGAKYLSWLLKRFNNNTHLAIAAYNAGEGNVDKYGGIPPFRETQDYVRRVTSRYQNLYRGSNNADIIPSGDTVESGVKILASSNPSHRMTPSVPQREIVFSQGRYTNNLGTPMETTYATENAMARANIQISQ